MDLREQRFGIEIEMTGITRAEAAQAMAKYFDTAPTYDGSYYDVYSATDPVGRKWRCTFDSSIHSQKKENGRKLIANQDYKVEVVSPICTYADIDTIQEIVRVLRKEGAFVNSSCGIHIHIDSAPYEARQIRNLVNIVASKEDMFYKALQVKESREHRFCKKIDPEFLEQINKKKPRTMDGLKNLWYKGRDGSHQHYHDSRYHCLNLHSVFQKGTIEFRAFNSNLHAGKLKAYIQFCLAVTAQAYNQRCASPIKTQSSNEKYTFRVWLLRLGMIGEEFKTARQHLLNHLEGNIAWKDPMQAVEQRERMRKKREEALLSNDNQSMDERAEEQREEMEQEITMQM